MKSKSPLILFLSLMLAVGYLTSVQAVTDAELDALEKQLEQQEIEEDTELEALEKQLEQQEVEKTEKEETERKANIEAQKKAEEEKRLAEERRKLEEEKEIIKEEKRKQETEEKRLTNLPIPKTWNIGGTLIVNWSKDKYWYPATVKKKDGERYFVVFDDGDEEWTTVNRMAVEDMREGDMVFGNWQKRGKYYPGRITHRVGREIHIKYDDGDEENRPCHEFCVTALFKCNPLVGLRTQ
jgi:hypothetical protein